MKVIIEISDASYETVKNGTWCGSLYEELKNGTPLEEAEDCVSRQAVLDLIYNSWAHNAVGENYGELSIDALKALPPVTAEKVGHWIDHQEDRWIYAKCSECETVHDSRTNYCPHCGAKMQEVE